MLVGTLLVRMWKLCLVACLDTFRIGACMLSTFDFRPSILIYSAHEQLHSHAVRHGPLAESALYQPITAPQIPTIAVASAGLHSSLQTILLNPPTQCQRYKGR